MSGQTLRTRRRQGFDFTTRMRLLCEDIATRLPAAGHIDMQRVAVSFAQARKRSSHGLFATLTPLRFKDGQRTEIRRGQKYVCQRVIDEAGREVLYILCFYLPRFLDVDFQEKMVTIFHELWHIHPGFNGDLRRHEGRCYMHTRSQKEYDQNMALLVDEYLSLDPPAELFSFLKSDFDQIQSRYGQVYGVKIPQPKLIPLPK